MADRKRKRDTLYIYLRNIAGAIIALPVSLLLITVIIVIAVLLLPLLWALIIVWWVNGFKIALTGEKQDEIECECEDGEHGHE
jgi:hypothetical protein